MNGRTKNAKVVTEGKLLLVALKASGEVENSGIARKSLDTVTALISERLALVESNSLPNRKERLAELTRLVVDEWPLGFVLGKRVSMWEEMYRNL